MKKTILFFSILLASCAGKQTQEIRTMERLSTASHNDYYVSNRAPLQPLQFIKLPAGSIEPEGWIRRQIELQKDGLCGHLGEISAWLQKENNAWLKNGGEWGWEEVPYWLRGYGNMAYALRDETLLKETKFWIEAILSSQRADGNFGPVHLNNGKQDFWPNMIVLWIMQSYHEYTNDNRVIDFMTRYCHYLQTVPDDAFLSSYWENSRGGDNLWSVVWLYNRMGDESLLRLAEKIHRNTADWTKSTQLPNWHNVNVAQCFREPATYFLFTKDSAMSKRCFNVLVPNWMFLFLLVLVTLYGRYAFLLLPHKVLSVFSYGQTASSGLFRNHTHTQHGISLPVKIIPNLPTGLKWNAEKSHCPVLLLVRLDILYPIPVWHKNHHPYILTSAFAFPHCQSSLHSAPKKNRPLRFLLPAEHLIALLSPVPLSFHTLP